MMTVIDLFSGCGGFSLGFEYFNDFKIVYALDNWETACQSYHSNFPYVDIDCRDALNVEPKDIPKADVIIGGPPCQEFSVARALGGEDRTFDTRLIDWFISVIEYHKPKYWIMENVPPVKEYIKKKCKKQVYRMTEYGVPQFRRRLFVGAYEEPRPEPISIVFPTVINEAGGATYRPPNLGIRLGSVFRRRSLIYEALLVQTFPLDFVLHGELNERYKQISNAVPPLMAYRLADALIDPYERSLPKDW